MSWNLLENLLNKIFREINTTNNIPLPEQIWHSYQSAISNLSLTSDQEILRQIINISLEPNPILLPKAVEIARLLRNLKQRKSPTGGDPKLVGKIRAMVIPRHRPPFDKETSSLKGYLQEIAQIGNKTKYSKFQIDGWSKVRQAIAEKSAVVIAAPTGAGKSEVFMLPIIHQIINAIEQKSTIVPRFIMLYPRVELLKDQLERIFRYVWHAEQQLLTKSIEFNKIQQKQQGIIIGFQFKGVKADRKTTFKERQIFDKNKMFLILKSCPICSDKDLGGKLFVEKTHSGITHLKCDNSRCSAEFKTSISRDDHAEVKPHILVTTDESLSRMYLTPRADMEDYLKSITGVVYDEAHLYHSLAGAHLYNLIKNIERLKGKTDKNNQIARIASSATITNPKLFASKLFYGNESSKVFLHDANDFNSEAAGLEIVYFLQAPKEDNSPKPNSTMIQAVMGFGHGVFSDQSVEHRNRAILFTDSIDMANRFKSQIQDAESVRKLWQFRSTVSDIIYNGSPCPLTDPAKCSQVYYAGECWRGIIGGSQCVPTPEVLESPMSINCISSKNKTSRYEEGDVVVATASLEVGVDDARIKAIFHYRPPKSVFSFIQRRGRAGRSRGDIAYSIMVLGNESPDNFYLYRRNRLISASSYNLPLNPQNVRITKMHEKLAVERQRLANSIKKYVGPTSSGAQEGILEWVFEILTRCTVINGLYHDELNSIQRLGDANSKHNELGKWIERERRKYESYLNIEWTLEEVEDQSPVELRILTQEVRKLVEDFLKGDHTLLALIRSKIVVIAKEFTEVIDKESSTFKKRELQRLRERLEYISEAVKEVKIGSFNQEFLIGLYDFFRVLGTDSRDYWFFNYEPGIIKTFLQAFFYLGLSTHKLSSRHHCDSCISFFIPDAFFQQVKPLIVELRDYVLNSEERLTQESVSDLASLFFPYKTHYRYFGPNDLTIVETDLISQRSEFVDGVATVRLRLRGEGHRSPVKFEPQRVYARPLSSDLEGHGVVKICLQCFALYGLNINRQCHGLRLQPVKLIAEPIVTRVGQPDNSDPIHRFGITLDYLSVKGETIIEGSEVKAYEVKPIGNNQWIRNDRREHLFKAIYEQPVAYSIPTRAIRWNLINIINNLLIDENLQKELLTFEKTLSPTLILHTSAHMLYKAISSIGGVNQEVLEYAINESEGTVIVWERYDGGAGISETIMENFRTEPRELYREFLSSVICPIKLEEFVKGSIVPREIKKNLASKYFLPENDDFFDLVISEAQAERNSGLYAERKADDHKSCIDGCSVCLHINSCIDRDEQKKSTSRLVAQAIIKQFVKTVNKSELDALISDCLSNYLPIPATLQTNAITGESNVLLL